MLRMSVPKINDSKEYTSEKLGKRVDFANTFASNGLAIVAQVEIVRKE